VPQRFGIQSAVGRLACRVAYLNGLLIHYPGRHAAVPRIPDDCQQPRPRVGVAQRRKEAHRANAGVLHYVFGFHVVVCQPTRVVERSVEVGEGRFIEPSRSHPPRRRPAKPSVYSREYFDGAAGLLTSMALIGRMHPLLVHSPIALVLMAAVAEAIAPFTGEWRGRTVAVANVRAGAAFGLVAPVGGWRLVLAPGIEASGVLEFHRWVGAVAATATVGAALVTCGSDARIAITDAPLESDTMSAGAHGVAVDNFSCAPATASVRAGSTITPTNRDGVPHNIVSTAQKFKSPVLDTDQQFSHRLDTAGTYTYLCSVHPKMAGQIVEG
jgi:plastocyanin